MPLAGGTAHLGGQEGKIKTSVLGVGVAQALYPVNCLSSIVIAK
jgi:phosphoribosylcarboxyaminoimidazole (NCAIR) mutase